MTKSLILVGAGCPRELAKRLEMLGVPMMTTWQSADLLPEDSPVFVGRPGAIGQRAANIIQQRAENVYIFGASMDAQQVGYRIDNFAPYAEKNIIDIDEDELEKIPSDWFKIKRDLRGNLDDLDLIFDKDDGWLKWCKDIYNRFRYELDGENKIEDYVDLYYFVRKLSEACQEGEIIVPGSSGTQSNVIMQAFKVKRGQRIMLCNTIGAMGMEPMAIGAAIATGKRVAMITGDGGFFMNMQELETVKRLNLPIKYFVFCNGGYGSIKTMQDARFNLRVGADEQSGFTLPDLERVAAVWGFPFHEIHDNSETDVIKKVLDAGGPAIVRVHSSMAFVYACKVNASLHGNEFRVDDMDDMTPKIDLGKL